METPEESVSVGGRKIPLANWEAEVTARAAAWVSIFDGAALLVVCLYCILPAIGPGQRRNQDLLCPGMFALLSGLLLVWAGRALFRRSTGARTMFLVLGIGVLPLTAVFALIGTHALEGGLRHGAPPVDALIAALVSIIALVTNLFAIITWFSWRTQGLVDPPGLKMLDRLHQPPLAPLGSVFDAHGNMRGWVAVGMTLLAALGLVMFIDWFVYFAHP